MIIKEGTNLFRVTSVLHVTPGNWRGFVQTKLRNISTGVAHEKRFSSEDKVEKATLELKNFEYLYEHEGDFFFMDLQNHEQISMNQSQMDDLNLYLMPNQSVPIIFYEGKVLGIELPSSVSLRVESTVPGLKTATVTASTKPATLETGLVVQVPQFINAGDIIRIDTSSNAYIERVKK